MSQDIGLKDLKNKPFLDAQLEIDSRLPKRAYIYLFIEVILAFEVLASFDWIADSYPLFAPTLLGALSAAIAQSLNQIIKRKHSINKLLKFITWGSINGCFTAIWFDILTRRVENKVRQVLLDQTIAAPLFQLSFAVLSAIWENDSILSKSFRSTYVKSLRYSYCYWPFVATCMFMMVSQEKQFLFNSFASFVWNMILCKFS